MARQNGPRQRWLSGFGALDWRSDERAYASLLDALTRDRLEVEAVEREMQATARRSMAEVQHDQERAEHDELAEARRELDDFRSAMADIRERSGPEAKNEVAYDSRDQVPCSSSTWSGPATPRCAPRSRSPGNTFTSSAWTGQGCARSPMPRVTRSHSKLQSF